MKQVIVIALVMFLASSVSGFAGDIEVVQGTTHLEISSAVGENRLVEWDTMLKNTCGEERTVKLNCRFLDESDQVVTEHVQHVKVKANETRPVKGSKLMKKGDADRVLAVKVEVQ